MRKNGWPICRVYRREYRTWTSISFECTPKPEYTALLGEAHDTGEWEIRSLDLECEIVNSGKEEGYDNWRRLLFAEHAAKEALKKEYPWIVFKKQKTFAEK